MGKGINVEGIGEVLGIIGGAATGASLAIGADSLADSVPSIDIGAVVVVGAGATGGFALARSQNYPPVVGAIGGGLLALVLRPMLGV